MRSQTLTTFADKLLWTWKEKHTEKPWTPVFLLAHGLLLGEIICFLWSSFVLPQVLSEKGHTPALSDCSRATKYAAIAGPGGFEHHRKPHILFLSEKPEKARNLALLEKTQV